MKKYLSIFIFPIIFSCNILRTASFDQTAYQKTVEIKVEADRLIDKSKEDYSIYEKDVEKLKSQVAFILEYEKNRPNNEISYTIWELMNNKDKNLLMSYFELWKKNKAVSNSFSEEARKQIDEAFSLLLKYEASKTKENEANLLDIINMKK